MTNRTLPIQFVAKYGMFRIIAQSVDGRWWQLNHKFACDDIRFKSTLQRIEDAGKIDVSHWTSSRSL